MAEEAQNKDEEIQEILSDLDNILSDLSGGDPAGAEAIANAASTITPRVSTPAAPKPPVELTPPAPKPVVQAPAPAVVPPPAPKPVVQAPPPIVAAAPAVAAPPPPAPVPVRESAPQAAPQAPDDGLKIELAPREGMLTSPKKAPPPAAAKPASRAALPSKPPMELSLGETAAPAPAPTPVPIEPEPPPAAAPAPVAAAPAPAAAEPPPAHKVGIKPVPMSDDVPLELPSNSTDGIPEKTAKDQIRRVAILFSPSQAEAKDLFLGFLDQSALTISKKPIYLRKVVVEAFAAQGDAQGVVTKAKGARVVAVLALADGLPDAKVKDLEDACSAAGISFRTIASTEVQKRSTVVDIMVDMMLLPGES